MGYGSLIPAATAAGELTSEFSRARPAAVKGFRYDGSGVGLSWL